MYTDGGLAVGLRPAGFQGPLGAAHEAIARFYHSAQPGETRRMACSTTFPGPDGRPVPRRYPELLGPNGRKNVPKTRAAYLKQSLKLESHAIGLLAERVYGLAATRVGERDARCWELSFRSAVVTDAAGARAGASANADSRGGATDMQASGSSGDISVVGGGDSKAEAVVAAADWLRHWQEVLADEQSCCGWLTSEVMQSFVEAGLGGNCYLK